MAHEITLQPEQHAIHIRLWDSLDGGEISQILEETRNLPERLELPYTVWDGLAISRFVLIPEEVSHIRTVVQDVIHQIGPGKTALVVQREIDVTVASLFRALIRTMGEEIQVFGSLEEAYSWFNAERKSTGTPRYR